MAFASASRKRRRSSPQTATSPTFPAHAAASGWSPAGSSQCTVLLRVFTTVTVPLSVFATIRREPSAETSSSEFEEPAGSVSE